LKVFNVKSSWAVYLAIDMAFNIAFNMAFNMVSSCELVAFDWNTHKYLKHRVFH